jgi:hypothetical protein
VFDLSSGIRVARYVKRNPRQGFVDLLPPKAVYEGGDFREGKPEVFEDPGAGSEFFGLPKMADRMATGGAFSFPYFFWACKRNRAGSRAERLGRCLGFLIKGTHGPRRIQTET